MSVRSWLVRAREGWWWEVIAKVSHWFFSFLDAGELPPSPTTYPRVVLCRSSRSWQTGMLFGHLGIAKVHGLFGISSHSVFFPRKANYVVFCFHLDSTTGWAKSADATL
jgi:hypothetical protein